MKKLSITCLFLLGVWSLPSWGQQQSLIVGKWSMHQVVRNGEDVTAEHNPAKDRWIEFHADGTFNSDGTPYGPNSGRYELAGENTLYLDSDAGEEDDSNWKYEIKQNQMTWEGLGSEFAREFVIVHSRNP